MVISKQHIIRNNKNFYNKPDPTVTKPYKVWNQLAPTQDRIRQVIKDNPNCVISDIYNKLPDVDRANIRTIIRKMVEGHRVIQRFSIP